MNINLKDDVNLGLPQIIESRNNEKYLIYE